jgi:hypothetical protein
VVRRQITLGFADVDSASASCIVVAYEPVWAIGTGKASSGENANAVVKQVIRSALGGLFNDAIAESIRGQRRFGDAANAQIFLSRRSTAHSSAAPACLTNLWDHKGGGKIIITPSPEGRGLG